jgi:hypothetical protein
VPTEAEIKRIIELYDNGNGLSHGQIAKKLNYNQSTITRAINNFLKRNQDAEGNAHDAMHRCNTKKATEAKGTYDRARRIALNDRLFTRLEVLMTDSEISASDFKNFVISYGILEDKRSLLDPPTGTNGVAAIDYYVERMKHETPKDEPETEA